MVAKNIFNAYKTVYDIATKGSYIAIGDNYGKISIIETQDWQTISVCQTSLSVIYNLQCQNDILVASGIGGVELFKWTNDNKLESVKKLTNFQSNQSVLIENKVVTGTADGRLVVHDFNGSVIEEAIISSETIQGVCYSKSRNLLATCGEDGLVRVWDCRQSLSKCTKQLNPGSHQMTRRKEKYLSSISMRDDWLACGGGPAMALWHIGAEEPASLLDLGGDGTTPQITLQAETRVLVGGSDGMIHQFKNNGHSISNVVTSSNMVYSLTESSSGLLYCGGNTSVIDVYKNYGYRTNQVQT